jgi:hypothetical protein
MGSRSHLTTGCGGRRFALPLNSTWLGTPRPTRRWACEKTSGALTPGPLLSGPSHYDRPALSRPSPMIKRQECDAIPLPKMK